MRRQREKWLPWYAPACLAESARGEAVRSARTRYGAAVKLLLIRHAQSENNVIEDRPDYAQARQPNPPLTAHRHASARQFAQDADLSGVTHLYTSLMLRAVQTAVWAGWSG